MMGLINKLVSKMKYRNVKEDDRNIYEFCPRCDANLTLQKGYRNTLPYWNCKGCGEMLMNPAVEAKDDIVWICDKCESMLNIQKGFSDNKGLWKCTECGHTNKIDSSELYDFTDEYKASLMNPYKGLPDEAVLELSVYEDIDCINGREDIILTRNREDGKRYVKKYLKDYDINVYQILRDNPVLHMPKVTGLYEGTNNLVVIEEYIEGSTLTDILENGVLGQTRAIHIACSICEILSDLHSMDRPIIHRDIKPSNIMISTDDEVYLLDMNVAKFFKPEETEDTKLLGTLYYAAPEQFGYGFFASSEKSDVYAVGVLLNVMLTGKLPKEQKAAEPLWSIIQHCICLEPEKRYTTGELIIALRRCIGNEG